MYSVIKVPMRVIDFIEDIPRIYESHETGDIFYYDPDNGFHEKLMDYGFLEHLKKDECKYFCDVFSLNFDNKEYVQDEELDVKNVSIEVLNNLAVLGQIKKVLITKEKPVLKKYIQISKDLEFEKFADFKAKVKELCNIDIQHHNNTITEEQENIIYEALNSGN